MDVEPDETESATFEDDSAAEVVVGREPEPEPEGGEAAVGGALMEPPSFLE